MMRWKLKEVLIKKQLSIKQAARLSGVSYSRVGKLCLYPLQDSKVHTLGKLADVLAMRYEELIESERRYEDSNRH